MEVIVGKTSGFCAGVLNAVSKTDKFLEENKDKKIYCIGEIVHNEVVVKNLENKGLNKVNTIEEIPSSSVAIVRAHGISKNIYDIAEKRKIKLYDLTCPKVKKIHDIVENYVNNSKYIIIVGNSKHPEVIGIKGFCKNNYYIIENIEDVEKAFFNIEKSGLKEIEIVSQTTESVEKFNDICNKILALYNDKYTININNTICKATSLRQNETELLSKNVEFMIVIGGKNSSNTKKLFQISEKNCKTILVKDYNEFIDYLNIENFKKYSKIGIMAGASTPRDSIDLIVEKLCKL